MIMPWINMFWRPNRSNVDTSLQVEPAKRFAESLKEVLMEISSKTGIPSPKCETLFASNDYANLVISGGLPSWSNELHLPDKVPVYVEDYFGGKVIKQEATKVIHITRDGEVKTGLTKKPADKNYKYLLQRD